MPRNPTVCLLSKDEFAETAGPLTVAFEGQNIDDGVAIEAIPQMFNSGGMGWQFDGNIEAMVNGKPTKVWVKLVASIVGSKKV